MSDPITEAPVVDTPEQPPVDGGAQSAELPTGAPAGGQEDPVNPSAESAPAAPQDPVNKRFSSLTRERDEALRRADEANRRLDEAIGALRSVHGAQPVEPAQPVEEPALVEPTFETPEQYQRDMAEYVRQVTERTAKTAMKAAMAEQERTRQQADLSARQTAIQTAWVQRREKAISETPDYLEVAENPNVSITQPMASVITTDEAGPKLAYYLGQHPEEAARIAQLNSFAQIVELGALRERILTPQKPTTSRTPAPITPVKGAVTPTSKSPDDMSMEEYAAARRRH